MSKFLAWGLSFCTGCAVMVLEIAASRVMSPVVGSSLYTWTAIIGTVLFGLAIGAYVGGRIIDRRPNIRTLAIGFFCASAAALFIVCIAPSAPLLTGLPLSVPVLTTAIALLLFLPVAFLLGTLQPMIVRLSVSDVENLGGTYGLLSAVWSFGSIVGVFLTGFYLIPTLGTIKTILLVAATLALSGGTLIRSGRSSVLAIVAVLTVVLWGNAPMVLGKNVVYAKDTAYYRAVVVDADLLGYGASRILFLDLDTHSIARGEILSPIYTDITRLLERSHTPTSTTFFIGGGAFTMPNSLASSSRVTVAEVDEAVSDIAKEFFLVDPNIETLITDARIHLRRDPKSYTLIVGDAFSSYSSVPWHLMTKEFFTLVDEHLAVGGIYAMNIISGRASEKGLLFGSVDRTLRSVFPHVERYAFGGSPDEPQNIVFLASRSPLSSIVEAGKTLPVVSGSTLTFEEIRIPPPNHEGSILTDDHAPTELLLAPVTKASLPLSVRLYRALTQG